MLSLSDVGALTYHKEALDLGEVITDALSVHAHALSAKCIVASIDIPSGAMVLGDADRLAQVIGNLLQNTLRYTDAPGRLDVKLRADGSRALLAWQDSSPGVSSDDLPRLTERLYRVDASRSRAGGGTGLGLAITKAIVQAHGGEMVASASPLGGVRWEIVFPLVETAGRPNHG
jgi:two-component system sensor histidine kinase BaeS